MNPKLVVNGKETEVAFADAVPMFQGASRRFAIAGDELSGFSFERGGSLQLALFRDAGATTSVRVEFVDADLLPGEEFARDVVPGAGIAISIGAPWPAWSEASSEKWAPWWKARASIPWGKVDVGWTFTTGSPRNRFFPELERAAFDSPLRYPGPKILGAGPFKGCSPDTARVLDRAVRWQLQRRFNARGVLGYPASLAGAPVKPLPSYALAESGTITSYDSHHFTLRPLAEAFRLTGSPLALDQLCALLSHALEVEPYFNAKWHWPYGGQPRPAGRLLEGLADALEVLPHAFPFTLPLYERCLDVAAEHVDLLLGLGFNAHGLPNLASGPDARHLPVKHNLPPFDALIAFGALRLHEIAAIPGALALGTAYLEYLEQHGWNQKDAAFDSIPNDPTSGVLPKAAPGNGVGTWLAPALIIGGRLDSPLLKALLETATKAKVAGGGSWLNATNWQAVSTFGPLVPE